jgi:hypothetical protein
MRYQARGTPGENAFVCGQRLGQGIDAPALEVDMARVEQVWAWLNRDDLFL